MDKSSREVRKRKGHLESCDMLYSDSPFILCPSRGKNPWFAVHQRRQQPQTLLHRHRESAFSSICKISSASVLHPMCILEKQGCPDECAHCCSTISKLQATHAKLISQSRTGAQRLPLIMPILGVPRNPKRSYPSLTSDQSNL